jgi:hypothetical protein
MPPIARSAESALRSCWRVSFGKDGLQSGLDGHPKIRVADRSPFFTFPPRLHGVSTFAAYRESQKAARHRR